MSNKYISVILVLSSIALAFGIYAYFAYFYSGIPEEEAWAPVAGIFIALIFGGITFICSFIYMIVLFSKDD